VRRGGRFRWEQVAKRRGYVVRAIFRALMTS
jgi:hypothetical protein